MSLSLNFDDDLLTCFNEVDPWIKLNSIDWSYLTQQATLKTVRKNTILYFQQEYNDYVYIVKNGRVKLSVYSKDGEEKSLAIAEEGCIVGEISILADLPNLDMATTLVECDLFLIHKNQFNRILLENAHTSMNLAKALTKKFRILSSHIEELSFRDASFRVANSLIKLARQHGTFSPQGCKLNVKFTHQEMANLTGLCRVTVSTIMSNLFYDGVLHKKNGHVTIKNFDKLLKLARGTKT